MNELKKYLKEKIREERICSFSLNINKDGKDLELIAGGYSVLNPMKIKAGGKTIYDIASLTKPLVTAFLMAYLLQENLIKLSDTLDKFFEKIPEEKKSITLEQLLCHRSGYIKWKPLYYEAKGFKQILEKAILSEFEYKPNDFVNYSCINYIILKGVIEEVTGISYIKLFEEIIKDRLKLKNTYFNPSKQLRKKISATEMGNRYEANKAKLEFGVNVPKRKEIIWGEVHDSNSFYAGGTAGNAGLFSNAEDVKKIALQFVPEYSTIFKSNILQLFYKNMSPPNCIRRSIGFILNSGEITGWADGLSEKTIYHSGFTGGFITIDSSINLVIILLMNRVHPYVVEPSPKDICKRVQEIILKKYV